MEIRFAGDLFDHVMIDVGVDVATTTPLAFVERSELIATDESVVLPDMVTPELSVCNADQ